MAIPSNSRNLASLLSPSSSRSAANSTPGDGKAGFLSRLLAASSEPKTAAGVASETSAGDAYERARSSSRLQELLGSGGR